MSPTFQKNTSFPQPVPPCLPVGNPLQQHSLWPTFRTGEPQFFCSVSSVTGSKSTQKKEKTSNDLKPSQGRAVTKTTNHPAQSPSSCSNHKQEALWVVDARPGRIGLAVVAWSKATVIGLGICFARLHSDWELLHPLFFQPSVCFSLLLRCVSGAFPDMSP